MNKQLIFLLLLLILNIKSYSQILFEDGYFINNSDQKIACLIKNVDWKNNPTEFEYKLAQDANIQKENIETVKEFGIDGLSKYYRVNVKIDRSSDQIDDLNSTKNAIFSNEQLFLKVLIEGKASLFVYVNGNLKRFFYKTADSEINQLIHKRYLIKDKIAYNNYFRQQLLSNLESEIITIQDVRHLKYYKKGLLKLFTKYNNDVNSIYSKNKPKQKKDLFNLSIRPGISVNNFKMHNSSSAWKEFEFDQQIDFKFGIETEFILPFNNNKWSIILEPTYQSYKSKKELITNAVSGGVLHANIDYQSIEIPVGFRYYMHLNKNSKIFANMSYLFDFNSDSHIVLSRENGSTYDSLEIKPSGNLAFGMGYKFKDKYSFEIRYLTTRDLLHEYVNWNADYKALTITFGYSIF